MSEQGRTEKVTRPRKRSRGVPLVFGVVSLVLVAVALTFALSSPPPSTPPLAEVAPAPQERIEVERVEQSSQFGEGAGGEGECVPGDPGCEGVAPGPAEPTARPSPTVVDAETGQERGCYFGGTQSPDPQSPPCKVEIFEGDNGGATSTGVTKSVIRVAVPDSSAFLGGTAGTAFKKFWKAVEAHFNQYYELYGRQFELVLIDPPSTKTPAEERQFARDIAAQEVFASLDLSRGSPTYAFHQALADLGVVFTLGDPAFEEGDGRPARRFGGFGWSVHPSYDEAFQAGADLVCTALVGRPAQHGGEEVADLTRRFGVMVETREGIRLDPSVLVSRLEACGAPFATYEVDIDDSETVTLALRKMRDEGVTTIVCACRRMGPDHSDPAESLGYRPEWFAPGTDDFFVSNGVLKGQEKGMVPEQLRHAFAITPRMKRPDVAPAGTREQLQQQYWFHAVTEQDGSFEQPGSTRASEFYARYAQVLILASGIQWAGPDLTPTAFAEALEGLTFPNPGVGADPWWQPRVTFGASDHAFNSDFALLWFEVDELDDSNARRGRSCYVGGGTRYRVSEFPADADERLFDPEAGCR